MSSQRERSLDRLHGEILELRDRMRQVFPSYIASLKELSFLTEEFERRCWVSWIEEFLEKTRRSYQELVNQCMAVGFVGGMMANVMATITQQPMIPTEHLTPSLLVNLAIWPSGEVRPVLKDTPPAQKGVITVSFDEFERVVSQLENKTLSGGLVLQREEQIPKLVYNIFARDRSTT